MKKVISRYILVLVIVLAAILRLWNLGNNPPHLTPDEASLGYNAYSILKTGRDEYGQIFPMIFKSFGDYKPGMYVYLAVPSIALFGLTEFATRLPSAISGILIVYLIYLIAGKVFPNPKSLGIVASLVAATNPWLIYFSRGAWEVNVSLLFTLVGFYLFLRSFENSKYFILAVASYAVTLLTYQGAKLSTGIVLLLSVVIYWKDIKKVERKKLFVGGVVGLIIIIPILISILQGQIGRLSVFSVFSYPRPENYIQDFLNQGKENIGSLNYYAFHSESLNFMRGILGRYFNHFSGRFLFFEGDWGNPRHSAPNSGMLLLSDLVVLVFGVSCLIKNHKSLTKGNLFILLWLILAPLPAVLSRDQVHAVRAINMVVPIIFILSFGYTRLSKLFLPFAVIAFVYFLDANYIHLRVHSSKQWEYGYKQVVETVTPIQSQYKTVKVQQSFSQPYIYFLFYQKYNPVKYQESARLTVADSALDVGYVTKLDNIQFVPIDWSVSRGEKGTLFVADSVRIPPEDSQGADPFEVINEIKYLNGRDIAFRIVGIK